MNHMNRLNRLIFGKLENDNRGIGKIFRRGFKKISGSNGSCGSSGSSGEAQAEPAMAKDLGIVFSLGFFPEAKEGVVAGGAVGFKGVDFGKARDLTEFVFD